MRKPSKSLEAREELRRRYRPQAVKILFVGESPPASGRFFYQADSGLYRAVRQTFLLAFPKLKNEEFLESFQALGCYLVDLCATPVDDLVRGERARACHAGEARLARTIGVLRPEVIVTVVRSIGENVERATAQAGWRGTMVEVPYPGRWQSHRVEFQKRVVPLLRKTLGPSPVVAGDMLIAGRNARI